MKHQEIKLTPRNIVDNPNANLDKIMESANIAMARFNKRMNDET